MEEYTAISDSNLIEDTVLEFDLYLKSYDNRNSKYILFSRGNEKFNSNRKEELLRKKANRLFISTNDIEKYFNYQERNLQYVIADKNRNSLEKSNVVYQVASNLAKDLLNSPRSFRHLERARKWVMNTVAYILCDENTYSSMFKVASHDYNLFTHSINVTVFGLLFGKYLSLNQSELNCLGRGMLLHDIGKTDIPLKILNKPCGLTKDEFIVLKKHPKVGVMLLKNQRGIEESSFNVIMQHHENNDGTGYPQGIGGREIHMFGSMSRIIDVYDAATTTKPYAEAKRPFAVLAEMREKMVNCFDKELFREFIYFLGPKDMRGKRRYNDTLSKHAAQVTVNQVFQFENPPVMCN